MRPLRRAARFVLRIPASLVADDEWTRAMLHELDYIASDTAALLWALGSALALVRTSRAIGDAIVGLFIGVGVALLIAALFMGSVATAFQLFPRAVEQTPLYMWIGVVIFCAGVFAFGVTRLWRRRRAVALGFLLVGLTAVVHFTMHLLVQNFASGT